jgi:hypothetical protein
MFGLLMIFGQIRGEPWYGQYACPIENLTTSPRHIKLTWSRLLSVAWPIAAQIPPRTPLNLVNKPQRAGCRHDQTKRVGAHDELPLAALILAESVKALASRISISTAQRARYSLKMS